MGETVPVWRVDQALSDDEQNIIIVTYATADGGRAYRKELAVPSVGTGLVDVPKREEVPPADLSTVDDPETREWYKHAVEAMRHERSD